MPISTKEDFSAFLQHLSDTYDDCKLSGISQRHFKSAEMMEIIWRLQSQYPKLFKVEEVGRSVEGRSNNLITLGNGRKKVFMWSQMHGDESTATRALLDMLNMIGSNTSEPFIRTILKETTLLLLPMVNPDGAERFERRNAQGIDINRDAVALQTPEARTLKAIRDDFAPEFGFNLHDQEPRFAVGRTNHIAAIALLAPTYDEAKSTNEVRRRAKHLAAFIAEAISHFVPSHVSRYDDSFEPRAFGDAMQTWGTSTVLVESGGWLDPLTGHDDSEKEYLRKLNAIGLLASCHGIATEEYQSTDIAVYESLPENNKNVFDVLIKNARSRFGDSASSITVDVGVNVVEQRDGTTQEWKKTAQIADVGDLTPFMAFRTIDAEGRTLAIPTLALGTVIPLEQLENVGLFQE